ncbi:MAG: SDR family NAD(P)-dependent oxidoreductase [Francisellaceae bacterium]
MSLQKSVKTILLTGGSNGIGRACLKRFVLQRHHVINLDIADPSVEGLDFIKTDLADIEAITMAFDKIKSNYHSIDALVSAAGIHLSATIEDTTAKDYQRVVATNLSSTFFVLQQGIALMKKQGGRIVTIGSDQSFVAKPNSAVYGMTKAAIAQLTKSVAIDYAKYGIVANCVCPGTIETPLYWHAIKKYCEKSAAGIEDVHKEEALMQPIGRIGQPEEVASLINYLVNDAGGFLTGALIPVDGGYTAR